MKSASNSWVIAAHAAVLAAPASNGSWVQLMPAGRFSARDGRGPFNAGGPQELREIVQRSIRYAGSTDLVVDYDHQSIFGATEGVGGTAKAAGWVKELQARPDGVWGRVEWTEAAASAIRAGEYRYLSPVLRADKTSGRVLFIRMAAITNTPAFDLAEVAASADFNLSDGDDMDKIAAALGLAAGSGEDVVLSALTKLKANGTAIVAALGLKVDAAQADIVASATALVADRAKIAAAVGKSAADSAEDIVAAVQSVAPDPAKFVPIAAFSEVQARLKKVEDDAKDKTARDVVAKAVEAGKVPPAAEAWALDYAMSDAKGFEAYLAAMPKIVGGRQSQGARPAAGGDDAVEIAAKARAYQKKQADAGVTIDIVAAVAAVKEGKS